MALHEPMVCPRVSTLSLQDGYPEKVEKTQGEGVEVCKNHLVGSNRVELSCLEEMPEREYERGT